MKATRHIGMAALLLLLLVGCKGGDGPAKAKDESHDAPPPSNRIDVPSTVRSNLGITFVKVGYRKVSSTRRYPGRFEYRPASVLHYVTPVAGRVSLPSEKEGGLAQFQAVEKGALLFRLSSPEWHAMQRDLAAAEAALETARRARAEAAQTLKTSRATLEVLTRAAKAARDHIAALASQLKIQDAKIRRLEKLAGATGGRALDLEQARIDRAATGSSLAEAREEHVDVEQRKLLLQSQLAGSGSDKSVLESTVAEREAELASAGVRLDTLRRTAAKWHGVTVDVLLENVGRLPRWRVLDAIEVRASRAGVISELSGVDGSWVEANAHILSIVNPRGLRFHADAPQSEMAALRDGLPGRVVPPEGAGLPADAGVDGTIQLGPQGDLEQRTLSVFARLSDLGKAAWARAGVAAHLEVTIAGGGREELAIPKRAIIRDGLVDVFFRRDPRQPDKVIRVEADLGLSDGRWVEVKSGLAEGDEVVLRGVYPLMLASSQQGPRKAGHFHADGTWHEGEH